MFKEYVYFTLYGANNTPLFDDFQGLSPEARAGYSRILAGSDQSQLLEAVKELLEVAEKNQDQLTGEVERFREGQVEELVPDN